MFIVTSCITDGTDFISEETVVASLVTAGINQHSLLALVKWNVTTRTNPAHHLILHQSVGHRHF